MTKLSRYQIEVAHAQQQFSFDENQLSEIDLVPIGEGVYHLLDEHQSFRAKVVASDFAEKTYRIRINGSSYTIKLADHYDQLVAEMGLSTNAAARVSDIKAPMPGLVLKVGVEVGQTVAEGDQLLILEAMKMENVLKSSGAGVVKEILIKEGQAVDKGQLLIEMV